MLDRFLAALASALLSIIERRIGQQKTAVDADARPDILRRAGSRLREWMRREQDGVHPREQPDEDRP